MNKQGALPSLPQLHICKKHNVKTLFVLFRYYHFTGLPTKLLKYTHYNTMAENLVSMTHSSNRFAQLMVIERIVMPTWCYTIT